MIFAAPNGARITGPRVCCLHFAHGRYGALEWERSRQYDSDKIDPIDRGEVILIPCQTSHAYHYVRVT